MGIYYALRKFLRAPKVITVLSLSMWKSIQKTLSVIIISSVFLLSLHGCGSGEDSDTSSNDPATGVAGDFDVHSSVPNSTKSANVSGTVTGGLVDNALVIILAADTNTQAKQLLAAGHSKVDGTYSINIPAEYSGVIEVLVKADNKLPTTATMICDAWPDCGDAPWPGLYDLNQNGRIDFGEKFSLTKNFEMRAVSSVELGTDPISVSVTPMSSLAAAYAEQFPQGLDSISVSTANAQVANLLGMKGDFFTRPAADITDSLETAGYQELVYGIWSGAFLALVDDVNKIDIIFNQINKDFMLNNGQWLLFSENSNAVTLARLLQEALIITEKLLEQNNQLVEFKNYLLHKLAFAMASAGEYSSIEVSPGVGQTTQAQVGLFIDDLVNLGSQLDLSDVTTFGFSDQILLAQQAMLSNDTVSALVATGKYALALSLVPDIANNEDVLPYACSFLTGLAGTLCSSIAGKYTLAEICEGNITVLGLNFCSLLKPYLKIAIPTLESGLSVTFDVLTREVLVVGELNFQQVGLIFTVPELYSGKNILALVEGSISNAYDTFSVQGQFEVDMNADQVSLSEIKNLSSDQLGGYLILASSSALGAGNSVTISLGDVSSYTIGFESVLGGGEVAQTVLMGELINLTPVPDSVSIEYEGRVFDISTSTEASILNILNQDGIVTEFYLDLVGDGLLGAIYVDNVLYANVLREADLISAIPLDGDAVDISQIFQ